MSSAGMDCRAAVAARSAGCSYAFEERLSRRWSSGRAVVIVLRTLALGEPDHEPQPAPGDVDGAYLVVHEAGRERDLAHDVLRDVRLHLRRPLGPRDPQPG